MAGHLIQNYSDFWQPDNSLDHSVVGIHVIPVEMKLKSNVRKQ